MKFNVEAKDYHESMHYYWQLHHLHGYNEKIPKVRIFYIVHSGKFRPFRLSQELYNNAT